MIIIYHSYMDLIYLVNFYNRNNYKDKTEPNLDWKPIIP